MTTPHEFVATSSDSVLEKRHSVAKPYERVEQTPALFHSRHPDLFFFHIFDVDIVVDVIDA